MDAAPLLAPLLQRATGSLHLRLAQRAGPTALADLHQQGCLKARFPRPVARLEAVMLNTSGGIAGGDQLATDIALGPGAEATIASQAAERCYRVRPGDPPARLRAHIALGPGAALEWLPQETILFDGCALDRQLRVALAPTARFLGIEALVFGRAARGEVVRQAQLSDLIRIERDGAPILHDAVRLQGDAAAILDRPATAHGARAVATIVLVAADAERRLDAVRQVLAGCEAEAGASAWNGMMVARLLAPDERRLRAAVLRAAAPLRDGRPWPRAWQC